MKDHSIKFERQKGVRDINVGAKTPTLTAMLTMTLFLVVLFAAWGYVFAIYSETVSEALANFGPEGYAINVDFHEEFPDEGKRKIMAALLFSWFGVIGGVQLGAGKWFGARVRKHGRGIVWWTPYLITSCSLLAIGLVWSVLFSGYVFDDDDWEFGIVAILLCLYHIGIAIQIGAWRSKKSVREK